MKTLQRISLLALLFITRVQADSLSDIGLTTLRARDATLNGSGVNIAQVEAPLDANGTVYQVNPSFVGQSSSLFNYFDSTRTYPTGGSFSSGLESSHGDIVALNYYGNTTSPAPGIAPGVASIKNFEAAYFFNTIVNNRTDISTKIINQSFVFNTTNPTTQNTINYIYDDYAVRYNTLFVNGAGNGGYPGIPSTMFNGLSVGASGIVLTTPTDGRCKPDLISPGGPSGNLSSYATPFVSGAAALLIQSGSRGDGGSGTASSAIDIRTLRALLLNGASKSSDWTNSSSVPLDRRYGAGTLNINKSQSQLAGGLHTATITTSVSPGAAHLPPSPVSGNISSLLGWNLATLTDTSTTDSVDHYYFDLTSASGQAYDLVSTIAWNRPRGTPLPNTPQINNLALYLYKSDGTFVASSTSTIDNLQHLYLTALPKARYVLQVVKLATNEWSPSETYALAYQFTVTAPPNAPGSLTVSPASNSSITLNWSDNSSNETSFRIERSTSVSGGFVTAQSVPANTTTFTDTGLTSNTTYYYRVFAVGAGGDSAASTTASTTTYTDLQQWRKQNFGTTQSSGTASDTVDSDGDGLPNLVEYALGTDPNSTTGTNGTKPGVSITTNGSNRYATLNVTRSAVAVGVTYGAEVSSDLVNWSSDVSVVNNTATQLVIQDNTPIPLGGQRFIRLKITSP